MRITSAIFGISLYAATFLSLKVSAQDPTDYLKDKAKFPIGTAVNAKRLYSDARYQKMVKNEFSMITAENCMKMKALQPEEGKFNWGEADSLINWAAANNKVVHAHCLVWHESIPDWVNKYADDKDALEKVFKKHIQTVVAHFKGKVAAWDVYNEGFNDDGTFRQSPLLGKLGKEFIERCFTYARTVDGKPKLFYNDYGLEDNPAKLNAVYEMAKDLKKREIAIDGIGTQTHTYAEVKTGDIEKAVQKLGQTGLLVHISELDVCVNGKPNEDKKIVKFNQDLADKQADVYRSVVKAFKSLKPQNQYAITFWGFEDGKSWIRSYFKKTDWPHIFDEKLKRKAAYTAVYNAL